MDDEVRFRVARFDLRDSDDSTGEFDGHASIFGNRDSYDTTFDSGAFSKSINDHDGKFAICWMHDPYIPVGLAKVREDDKGLQVKGKLDLDIPDGKRVYSGMKKGYIDRMSHAFRVVQAYSKDGATHFTEVKLREVSPVTRLFAANDLALITQVRAQGGSQFEREMLQALVEQDPARLAAAFEGVLRAGGYTKPIADLFRGPGEPTQPDQTSTEKGEPDALATAIDLLRQTYKVAGGVSNA